MGSNFMSSKVFVLSSCTGVELSLLIFFGMVFAP